MHRSLVSRLAVVFSEMILFGCASTSSSSPGSWNFPVEGNVSSISHADLAAAIVAADATRIYRVRVMSRDRIRVDVSDGMHTVGDYDERGRHFLHRFRGEPDYVIVTRIAGKWESGGIVVSTY